MINKKVAEKRAKKEKSVYERERERSCLIVIKSKNESHLLIINKLRDNFRICNLIHCDCQIIDSNFHRLDELRFQRRRKN